MYAHTNKKACYSSFTGIFDVATLISPPFRNDYFLAFRLFSIFSHLNPLKIDTSSSESVSASQEIATRFIIYSSFRRPFGIIGD